MSQANDKEAAPSDLVDRQGVQSIAPNMQGDEGASQSSQHRPDAPPALQAEEHLRHEPLSPRAQRASGSTVSSSARLDTQKGRKDASRWSFEESASESGDSSRLSIQVQAPTLSDKASYSHLSGQASSGNQSKRSSNSFAFGSGSNSINKEPSSLCYLQRPTSPLLVTKRSSRTVERSPSQTSKYKPEEHLQANASSEGSAPDHTPPDLTLTVPDTADELAALPLPSTTVEFAKLSVSGLTDPTRQRAASAPILVAPQPRKISLLIQDPRFRSPGRSSYRTESITSSSSQSSANERFSRDTFQTAASKAPQPYFAGSSIFRESFSSVAPRPGDRVSVVASETGLRVFPVPDSPSQYSSDFLSDFAPTPPPRPKHKSSAAVLQRRLITSPIERADSPLPAPFLPGLNPLSGVWRTVTPDLVEPEPASLSYSLAKDWRYSSEPTDSSKARFQTLPLDRSAIRSSVSRESIVDDVQSPKSDLEKPHNPVEQLKRSRIWSKPLLPEAFWRRKRRSSDHSESTIKVERAGTRAWRGQSVDLPPLPVPLVPTVFSRASHDVSTSHQRHSALATSRSALIKRRDTVQIGINRQMDHPYRTAQMSSFDPRNFHQAHFRSVQPAQPSSNRSSRIVQRPQTATSFQNSHERVSGPDEERQRSSLIGSRPASPVSVHSARSTWGNADVANTRIRAASPTMSESARRKTKSDSRRSSAAPNRESTSAPRYSTHQGHQRYSSYNASQAKSMQYHSDRQRAQSNVAAVANHRDRHVRTASLPLNTFDVRGDFDNVSRPYSTVAQEVRSTSLQRNLSDPTREDASLDLRAANASSTNLISGDYKDVVLSSMPVLGTDWAADEGRMARKEARKSQFRQSKAGVAVNELGEWQRGERKLCGWFGWRHGVCVLFAIIVALGITLYFVIPRTPSVLISTSQPLALDTTYADPVFSHGPPATFDWHGVLNLAFDSTDNYIPIHLSSLSASIKDLNTNAVIATGSKTGLALPGKAQSTVALPIHFAYQANNDTDTTFQDIYKGCSKSYTGVTRPGLNLVVHLSMSIVGIIGSKTANTQLSDLACPFQLAASA
ncbi:hypothetical protein E5Q_05809 [Mixia osmundae IAM 14324]|uniref:Late embryogenesis abundant protein LEA-2 subgroup domain-containing protein n=1 Tax=Mixia osmundae (strain CBS 9802 / IAM 14324 / JCM 22182 / KY 12970) TaxID=764103 RepID=G7E8F8_MIXOS|nr:hypothetical protein E5Q_05809 [Mixia osmundae IAM 14324]